MDARDGRRRRRRDRRSADCRETVTPSLVAEVNRGPLIAALFAGLVVLYALNIG